MDVTETNVIKSATELLQSADFGHDCVLTLEADEDGMEMLAVRALDVEAVDSIDVGYQLNWLLRPLAKMGVMFYGQTVTSSGSARFRELSSQKGFSLWKSGFADAGGDAGLTTRFEVPSHDWAAVFSALGRSWEGWSGQAGAESALVLSESIGLSIDEASTEARAALEWLSSCHYSYSEFDFEALGYEAKDAAVEAWQAVRIPVDPSQPGGCVAVDLVQARRLANAVYTANTHYSLAA